MLGKRQRHGHKKSECQIPEEWKGVEEAIKAIPLCLQNKREPQ